MMANSRMVYENKKYQYKVSVVTAVYNVQEYLEEMIESIISQTIGFENIQLILVDDGSTDASFDICQMYHDKYPKNIISIKKKKSGVSATRNIGMEYIRGKYVNFCDSDDILEKDALEKMYVFLERNYEYIDLVSIPMTFFGAVNSEHILNYKYKKTKIVNLRISYTYIQLSMASVLVKADVVKKYKFNEKLLFAEDARLINEILLDKMQYGVISDTRYLYRKREGGGSAVDTGKYRYEYYIPCVKFFAYELLEKSKEIKGFVPKFIQYTCLYYLQWRIKDYPFVPKGILNEMERAEYISLMKNVFASLDDSIIVAPKKLTNIYKMRILGLKNHYSWELLYQEDNIYEVFGDESTISLGEYSAIYEMLSFDEQSIVLEGFIKNVLSRGNIQFYIENIDTGEKFKAKQFERDERNEYLFDEAICKGIGFIIRIPLDAIRENGCFKPYYSVNGHNIECKYIWLSNHFPITQNLKNSYLICNGYFIECNGNVLSIKMKTLFSGVLKECALLNELFHSKDRMERRGAFARIIYWMAKLLKHQEIWIISDRLMKADDNGEALFTYINTVAKSRKIKSYFLIDKSTDDAKRISKVGKIIDYNSFRYKVMALLCDKFISSQAGDYVFNRFNVYKYVYKNMIFPQKYIFLQHGVTKDDLSNWLNRYNTRLNMVVTVTKPEYASFLTYNYYFNEEQVKLTGFPRFDYLHDESNESRIITVMPTWRGYLTGALDIKSEKRALSNSFSESRYCKMFKEFFSSNKLVDILRQHDYTIQLMLHPNMPQECIKYFECPNEIVVLDSNTRYRDIFAKSRLIITDYSSTVFDFAYMRKPVLYYQADADEFFSGKHTYKKGYFDYEKDGFGEIAYNADELVVLLNEYLENKCQVKEKYLNRIENTFCFDDKDNCKRVYEEICKLR